MALLDGLDPQPENVKTASVLIQRCAMSPMFHSSSFQKLEFVIKEVCIVSYIHTHQSLKVSIWYLKSFCISEKFVPNSGILIRKNEYKWKAVKANATSG